MQQYNTRIQLKSDSEENWNKLAPKQGSAGFIPLSGELIIYSADNSHPYCRLKVGDGSTNVVQLPFIDSGTINGEEVEIVKLASFANRPQPGSPDKLYVDTSTNRIYHYDATSGYAQLSNFSFDVTKIGVSKITRWRSGRLTELSIDNNTLLIENGALPELNYYDTEAVSTITQE